MFATGDGGSSLRSHSLSSQLTDVIVEMASNIMLVDDHILWMSQKEEKACTSIVRSLEKIAAHTLSSNSQHMAVVSGGCLEMGGLRGGRQGGWAAAVGSLPVPGGLCPCQEISLPVLRVFTCARWSLCPCLGSLPVLGVSACAGGLWPFWGGYLAVPGLTAAPRCCAWQNSRNIAFEAYVVKPESYVGLSCVAFQRRDGGPAGRPPLAERGSEPMPDQQLRLRCTTGRPNVSLTSFHIKVGVSRRMGQGGTGGGRPLLTGDRAPAEQHRPGLHPAAAQPLRQPRPHHAAGRLQAPAPGLPQWQALLQHGQLLPPGRRRQTPQRGHAGHLRRDL